MDICNIDWQWFTPTNWINGITPSVSNLSLPGFGLILFPQFYHLPPGKSNYNYPILSEIHRHQPFNQCFFSFGFVDNTFITVSMLQIILSVFVIIICVSHGFQIFYRIILISTWRIIFISTWSICSFRIIIICLVS